MFAAIYTALLQPPFCLTREQVEIMLASFTKHEHKDVEIAAEKTLETQRRLQTDRAEYEKGFQKAAEHVLEMFEVPKLPTGLTEHTSYTKQKQQLQAHKEACEMLQEATATTMTYSQLYDLKHPRKGLTPPLEATDTDAPHIVEG